MKRFVRTSFAIAMLALLGVASYGQSSTGSISGVISDQNQAVIPAATITIKNTATGFTRSTSANAEGRYSFSEVPIGLYELTVESQTGVVQRCKRARAIDHKCKRSLNSFRPEPAMGKAGPLQSMVADF